MQSAIIIGVGPLDGLGEQLCCRFAEMGMHVYVAGRTESKIKEVVAHIEAAGGSASTYVCDATKEEQVKLLFEQARTTGPLSLAIYNAGNNMPGTIAEMEAAYFESSWKVGCFGGFLFAREAAQSMLPNKDGTILFTGASASLRGRANFGAFNSAKSALRTMVQALAKELGPEGIHVGHIIIDGVIDGDKIRERFPEYAEKLGDEGMINLTGIVDAYEFLYKQASSSWTFELDLRTALENW